MTEVSIKSLNIRDNDIRHIRNSHGESTNEKYPVTMRDIKQIPDIIENYDNVYYVPRDGKNGIYYEKRYNGTTFYLEQVTKSDDGRKQLSNKQIIKVPTGSIPKSKGLRKAINAKKRTNIDAHDNSDAYALKYTPYASNNGALIRSVPDSGENVTPSARNNFTQNSETNDAFDEASYQNAIDQYGVQNEPPATPVPQRTANNNRVSKFAQTTMDSGLLNETEQNDLRQRIVDGDEAFVYVPFTDVKAQKRSDITLSR